MRIGQVAEGSGVSTDTIRHYERIGLMPRPGRSATGYREYSETAIHRVRLIQNSLRFGFSLKQLQSFLGTRHAGGVPCKQVRAAGAQILESMELQISDLVAVRDAVREILKQWDHRLSQTPEGTKAYLLEALPDTIAPRLQRPLPPRKGSL